MAANHPLMSHGTRDRIDMPKITIDATSQKRNREALGIRTQTIEPDEQYYICEAEADCASDGINFTIHLVGIRHLVTDAWTIHPVVDTPTLTFAEARVFTNPTEASQYAETLANRYGLRLTD
jgi:hypothetical protein